MVHCPDSLVWELVKHNNCFLKKRSGKTKRTGTISFSAEKGNLKSISQFKYSGLANTRVFNIECTDDNKAEMTIKTASKCEKTQTHATIALNKSDFHKVEKTIKNTTANVFYRRDLEKDALGKWTQVYKANKRANGTLKTVSCKRGRGTL